MKKERRREEQREGIKEVELLRQFFITLPDYNSGEISAEK